jgi:DNA ligase-1
MRKLDGVRCITIIKNGEIRFYSRLGNEFTTLDVIRKELEKYQFPDGIVLDGELCVIENDTENFKLAVSQIKRKDYTMQDAHYKVFDALTFSEFISSSVPSPNYSHRIMRLKDLFRRCPNSPFLSVLGAIEYNPHNFSRAQNVVAQKGWEGLILRADTPYKFGRSSDILKVKSFTDSEYIIEDIVSTTKLMQQLDGTMKEVKCMGAIVIRHKGNPVKVGSGFTDAQRIDMWENDTKYIGKSVTIKYFEESTDEHGNPSLRFPIFVNFRETVE